MTYELAKQLKDAGFQKPERPKGYSEMHNRPISIRAYTQNDDITPDDTFAEAIYFPTLPELIDAIELKKHGNEVYTDFQLERISGWGDHLPGENNVFFINWRATKNRAAPTFDSVEVRADTPEEAVVKLWILLNKK